MMRVPFLHLILALAFVATRAICANLAATSGLIIVTEGDSGIGLFNRTTFERISTLSPPEGFSGIHDVFSPEGSGLLFAFDAESGVVGVYTNAGSLPRLREDSARDVSVSPFAGVSAANGSMVVSGGTGQLSVFSFDNGGDIELVANDIDLGTGQPDVLVSTSGRFAYVSIDFSGTVDGFGFGITTIDLENPSSDGNAVGLPGAGFADGVERPANFPIEAAVTDEVLFVAHGGGLSIFSLGDPSAPTLTDTVDVGLPAVNVDTAADGSFAVVVGGDSLARVDLPGGEVTSLTLEGLQGATSVSVLDGAAVIAGDDVLFCGSDCLQLESGGSDDDGDDNGTDSGNDTGADNGDGSGDDTTTPETNGDDEETDIGDGDDNEDGSEGDDDDDDDDDDDNGSGTPSPDAGACVEERYLLDLNIPRSALLQREGVLSPVLCPGYGLLCGTRRHVIRFEGAYMTYEEVCKSVQCAHDRRVVNAVSMRHARTLCGKEGNCVVPHVMWGDHWVERMVIGAVHSRIVRW